MSIAQEIDSLDTTIELVAKGLGVAILPRSAVRDEHWAGQVSISRTNLRRKLSLMRNPAHVLTHASVRIEHVTRSVMANLIAEGAWQGRMESD